MDSYGSTAPPMRTIGRGRYAPGLGRYGFLVVMRITPLASHASDWVI